MWTDDDWGEFFDTFSNLWPGYFGRGDAGPKSGQWRDAAVKFFPKTALEALKKIYADQDYARAPTLKLFKDTASAMVASSKTSPKDSRQSHCEVCLDVRSVEVEMFLLEPGSPVTQSAPVSLSEEFKFEKKTWDALDVRAGEELPECQRVTFPVWCPACARSWVPASGKATIFKNRLRGKYRPVRAMFEPHLRSMIAGTKLHEGPSMTCEQIAADTETWDVLERRYKDNPGALQHLGSWRKSLSKGLMPVALGGGGEREPGDE